MSFTITNIVEECGKTEEEKGWREHPRQTFGEFIALCHSELSEALEDHRNGRPETQMWEDEKGKPQGIPIELADVLIRIFSRCQASGIPIEEALRWKMSFNDTRPHRHGGKSL